MMSVLDRVVSGRTGWLRRSRRRKRLSLDNGVLQSMVTLCLMQEQFGPT
jgi:hypothetical protein